METKQALKEHLVSGGHTVVASMVMELAAQLLMHQDAFTAMEFDKALLHAVVLAVVRAGVKVGLPVAVSLLKDVAAYFRQ